MFFTDGQKGGQKYIADQNKISAIENWSGYGNAMPYDGIFFCGATVNVNQPIVRIYVNGTIVAYFGFNANANNVDIPCSIPFSKGDVITVSGTLFISCVRYYKQRDYTGR